MYENIYEPAEDSFLMEREIKSFLKNKSNLNVCEVGVGSGFVFSEIIRINPKNKYFGVDINLDAIKSTKKRLQKNKLNAELFKGNLLEPILEKQDLIFFNTPYLPCEDGDKYENLDLKDKAIYGGKNGYEVIFNFIDQINYKLKEDGVVFMLFSSLSKEDMIKEKLEREGFFVEEVIKEKHFMEELIIYKFSKSDLLKKLNKIGVERLKYLTKGKHSIIYQGEFNNFDVIVKCEDNSFIEKEFFFLNKLESESFVPKVFHQEEGLIVMEKCVGLIIKNFLEISNKKEIELVIDKILNICFKLDSEGFQKFELTNPYKHIFIDKNLDIKFIDFERTIFSDNPKNTTQFLQYIRRNKIQLRKKEIYIDEKKILDIAKTYKENKFKIKISNLLDIF